MRQMLPGRLRSAEHMVQVFNNKEPVEHLRP